MTLRILHLALVTSIFVALPSHAGFKDWVASKLPYKLPPEKLNFGSLRPESATEVVDRNGDRLFYLAGTKLRFYRPLDQISENLQKFVVLSEDAKFFNHEGFDLEEIENSLKKNLEKGSVKRGGSTITQQLVKNLFLDKKKSVTRKLFEVPWAMQLERDLTKKQILELYLNVIEWGPGIYGAEAASRHFFDKSAAELNPKEAIYLAMIVPNPPRFDGFASPKSREFIWSKTKTFAERIYSEKKIAIDERNVLLSEAAPLATLDQKSRKYPLQHASAKYAGSTKEFEEKWGKLASYIRKTAHGKNNPVVTVLDKRFDEALWQNPLVQDGPKDKKAPAPYLIFRDDKGMVAFKKLPKGSRISADPEIKSGLSVENDLSLEEIFYGRPFTVPSSASETVEGMGEQSASVGSPPL